MVFGMEPGQFAALVALFFIGSTILMPVLAFSARIALKPVSEALTRLRQNSDEAILQDRRIALLEAEVHMLNNAVQHMAEDDFRRQLGMPSASSSPVERRV